MLRILKPFISGLLVFCVFSGCKNKTDYDGQDIEFEPLEDVSFSLVLIPAGTALNLIAYSGGKPNSEGEVYYHQFIAVDARVNDTFRILVPIMTIPDEKNASNKIYVPISQYSTEKQVTAAVFYPIDSLNKMAVDLTIGTTIGDTTEQNISKINSIIDGKKIAKKEFVVINKSMDIFQRDYKTAIGVLHFNEIPW